MKKTNATIVDGQSRRPPVSPNVPVLKTRSVPESCANPGPEARRSYRGRRILVTGGMGFIGSNLTLALVRQGAQVTVVDAQVPGCGWSLANLEPVRGEIRFCGESIQNASCMRTLIPEQEVIFNLAGEISHINSMRNPLRDLTINSAAQLQFLDLCRTLNPGATIVYASSRQVYGRPKYLPVDENHPVHPADYNGVHKHAAEQYHFLLRETFGVNTVCLRLGNVYGPRQAILNECRGFIDAFVRAALEKREIVVFGSGCQLRGMTYVDDVVEAFVRAGAARRSPAAVYNIDHPQPHTLFEIARTLCRLAGAPEPRLAPFPAERLTIDIGDIFTRAEAFRRDFGWATQVDLEEGLERTLAYFDCEKRQELDGPARSLYA